MTGREDGEERRPPAVHPDWLAANDPGDGVDEEAFAAMLDRVRALLPPDVRARVADITRRRRS